jgi:hypothetical protein
MTHDEKLEVIRAMQETGGSFVRLLGEAWLHADESNSKRIQDAFPDYIARYRAIGISNRRRTLRPAPRVTHE